MGHINANSLQAFKDRCEAHLKTLNPVAHSRLSIGDLIRVLFGAGNASAEEVAVSQSFKQQPSFLSEPAGEILGTLETMIRVHRKREARQNPGDTAGVSS